MSPSWIGSYSKQFVFFGTAPLPRFYLYRLQLRATLCECANGAIPNAVREGEIDCCELRTVQRGEDNELVVGECALVAAVEGQLFQGATAQVEECVEVLRKGIGKQYYFKLAEIIKRLY